MRTLVSYILFLLLITGPRLWAQTSSSTSELEQLKSLVAIQQRELERQQTDIQALQLSLAEQKQILAGLMPHSTQGAAVVPAVSRVAEPSSDYHVTADVQTPPQGDQARPTDQEPTPAEQEAVEEELQRGPEIADVTPDTPALQLGPAKIRLIGYPQLTTVWRSTNSGGGVGTSFANIPFNNTIPGNTSEFRISSQSTRLAIRADADLKSTKAAGYFEMDFGGSPNSGTVAVTSSSYTFRVRQAWFDWSNSRWELTGGQLFTLMTPMKKDILPWPGDVSITQVVDQNYVAGLVWGRYPQIRVVYRASKQMSFGFSLENPEQQVGNNVVFPTGLNSIISTQYNTGSNELEVPNATPDFIFKGSYTGKMGERAIHLDAGAVTRVFRSWNGASNSGKDYAFGVGGNVNFTAEVVNGVRLVLNGFASEGAGRYVGGLTPDVIVKADGTISPIKSYAWVSGFEIAPSKATGAYLYYSGVYAQKNSTLNSSGTCCVGFGYPGANTNADRVIEEFSGGYSRVVWKHENLGSVQWGAQYSYLWLHPWVSGGGPNSANANMVFGQMRYNLP
jgi:hypothetical protein